MRKTKTNSYLALKCRHTHIFICSHPLCFSSNCILAYFMLVWNQCSRENTIYPDVTKG